MNAANTDQVARFADLTRAPRSPGYAHRRFLVTGPIGNYTDQELLEFCDYIPCLGGRVHRSENTAIVVAHTD